MRRCALVPSQLLILPASRMQLRAHPLRERERPPRWTFARNPRSHESKGATPFIGGAPWGAGTALGAGRYIVDELQHLGRRAVAVLTCTRQADAPLTIRAARAPARWAAKGGGRRRALRATCHGAARCATCPARVLHVPRAMARARQRCAPAGHSDARISSSHLASSPNFATPGASTISSPPSAIAMRVPDPRARGAAGWRAVAQRAAERWRCRVLSVRRPYCA